MAKRSYKRLGERELQILNTIWELGHASVGDVHNILAQQEDIAYTTVMTTMKKLADKGYLSYSSQDKKYVYEARIKPGDVRRGLLSDLISSAFKGSPLTLVRTLVEDEGLSDEQRDAIRKLIDSMDSTDNPSEDAS